MKVRVLAFGVLREMAGIEVAVQIEELGSEPPPLEAFDEPTEGAP